MANPIEQILDDVRNEVFHNKPVTLKDGLLDVSGLLTAMGMVADMERSKALGKQRELFKSLKQPQLTDFTRGLINKTLHEAALNMVQEVVKRNELSWTVVMIEHIANICASDDADQLRARLVVFMSVLTAWIENIDARKPRADEAIEQIGLLTPRGPHMAARTEDDDFGPAK